jgi:hypothetical protein
MIKKTRYNCNVMREIPKCDISDTPLFLSNYVTEKNTKDKFNAAIKDQNTLLNFYIICSKNLESE